MEDFSQQIQAFQKLIDSHNRIVFFGGAGVSTESGIPDFRSVDGLYNQKWNWPPEEILSNSFFYNNTHEFYRFFREKLIARNIKPNTAHYKLAELERAGKLSAVITQNIDGLHQLAGSKNVLELHGSTLRNFCTNCNTFYGVDFIDAAENVTDLPLCKYCGGLIKPDVVLYGENLNDYVYTSAIEELRAADMLIIGGTSLSVTPAAYLVQEFRGDSLVLINLRPTSGDSYADLVIHEKIGKVFGEISV